MAFKPVFLSVEIDTPKASIVMEVPQTLNVIFFLEEILISSSALILVLHLEFVSMLLFYFMLSDKSLFSFIRPLLFNVALVNLPLLKKELS